MALTNYAISKLSNHMLAKAAYSLPDVHAGLFTASPGLSGSLSNEVPLGRGYARKPVTSGMSTSSGGAAASNSADIVFGANSAVDWGNITHGALLDEVGNVLAYAAGARLIQVGDDYVLEAGRLIVDWDAGCALTNYARSKLTNHLTGKTAFTMPTTVYAALFTADPTLAGTLTNEVAASRGYARQAITSTMGTSTGGSVSANAADILFGPDTASNWGTITHIAIMDGGTIGAGNMLAKIAAPTAKLVQVDDYYRIKAGDLTVPFS